MDDHLGRDIRHDDLYEELAPITHCKFNKKVHAHSDELSYLSMVDLSIVVQVRLPEGKPIRSIFQITLWRLSEAV